MWDCTRCNFCVEVCPKDVKPMEAIIRLRRAAIERGFVTTGGARHILGFVDIVRREGRLNEALMPLKVVGHQFARLLSVLPLGFKMFLKGKVPNPFSPSIQGDRTRPRHLCRSPACEAILALMASSFRFLEDVALADTAFEATGDSLSELFTAAAGAVIETMVHRSSVGSSFERDVEHTEEDPASLLFDWLSDLVYLKDAEGVLFHAALATVTREAPSGRWRLHARLIGEPIRLKPS